MDFGLDQEQKLLRKEIIRFARAELNGTTEERDRSHSFSRELWDKIGALGLHGLPVDPEWGGSGLNAVSTAIALEALGYGCEDSGLTFSVYAHLLTCAIPIWKFGTDAHKERWLRGLCSGELIGGNAMTEPDSGSDAFTMRTVAVAEGDGFRINGTKTFASNAPVADVMVLYAANDPDKGFHGGVTAFVLDTKTEGVQIPKGIDKMGLRTSPMGEIILEDVFLPEEAVLGGVGGGGVLFTDSMVWERSCLFAGHVGTMERLLDLAVEQANTRKQFGQPIGKFQAIAHKVADMKIQLEAARLLTYKAAWSIDRRRGAPLNAAIAKTFVSDAYVKAALDTLQIFGGYGYMTETGVERIVRDAIGSPIYSGTNEVQRNIIARWLGL